MTAAFYAKDAGSRPRRNSRPAAIRARCTVVVAAAGSGDRRPCIGPRRDDAARSGAPVETGLTR
jgi:hypothetical protein